MPPRINGINIPTEMAGKGTLYDWQPPAIVGNSGLGRVVEAGLCKLNWGYDWMAQGDWDWWTTTLLAGARDALFTGATQLYDDNQVLRTITSCVVVKPMHRTVVNGVHRDVRIVIHQIVAT